MVWENTQNDQIGLNARKKTTKSTLPLCFISFVFFQLNSAINVFYYQIARLIIPVTIFLRIRFLLCGLCSPLSCFLSYWNMFFSDFCQGSCFKIREFPSVSVTCEVSCLRILTEFSKLNVGNCRVEISEEK